MSVRKIIDKGVRKISKIGKQSVGVTLPIDMIRQLGWKLKQKVVIKKIKGGVQIKDWKK